MLIKGDGKQVVYKTRHEILGIKCDICERELRFPKKSSEQGNMAFIKYFDVTTSHNDWGNDSYESLRHYDICPDCITVFATDYLANCGDTAIIEIEATKIYDGQLGLD